MLLDLPGNNTLDAGSSCFSSFFAGVLTGVGSIPNNESEVAVLWSSEALANVAAALPRFRGMVWGEVGLEEGGEYVLLETLRELRRGVEGPELRARFSVPLGEGVRSLR